MNRPLETPQSNGERQKGPSTGTESLRPFGDRLRAIREAHGLSQAELGRRAGLNHSAISRLEDGTRNPSLATVMSFATALEMDDLDTDHLREAAGFKARNSPEVDAFRRLSPEVQRAMLAMYEQIRRTAA